MKIALTGATGFIGRYLLNNLVDHSHELNCWYRSKSSLGPLSNIPAVTWKPGDLKDDDSAASLVEGCDAVIHNAFWRPGKKFQGEEGDIVTFVKTNLVGSLKLIEAAIEAKVKKFVFVSTCAVHEKILDDRALDEAHPLWPKTHYGAHKAAIEKFVHSYGLGHDFDICAIRPTGVYGLHHQPTQSKWFELVKSVVRGENVECFRGGKEVHAADVAKSIRLLLESSVQNGGSVTKGEVFSCYDRYISQFEVATLAKQLSGSSSIIGGQVTRPKNEIDNSKIRSMGMIFGGQQLLENTVKKLVEAAKIQ